MASRTSAPPPRHRTPPAPKHLEAPEAALWESLHAAYDMTDAGSLVLLTVTLEAHQRARRCRERVDKDGEAITDRFSQTKPHPLLHAERDARAAFISGMKALCLDLGAAQ